MTIRSHLSLYRRHWIIIVLLTLITGGASYYYGLQKATRPYETTLFISLGVAQTETNFNPDSPYDYGQAADNFTETVQGWFKNPGLLNEINESVGEDIDISARRQEKQNLVITFDAPSEKKAQEISD
ncbi:MAG TPA: hypothetical protein VI588_05055, partial [Candidatus Gracilibacteria bacterium]|nr:hypothetical protein [Candidatus Gracilibacteria bacterium]